MLLLRLVFDGLVTVSAGDCEAPTVGDCIALVSLQLGPDEQARFSAFLDDVADLELRVESLSCSHDHLLLFNRPESLFEALGQKLHEEGPLAEAWLLQFLHLLMESALRFQGFHGLCLGQALGRIIGVAGAELKEVLDLIDVLGASVVRLAKDGDDGEGDASNTTNVGDYRHEVLFPLVDSLCHKRIKIDRALNESFFIVPLRPWEGYDACELRFPEIEGLL